MLCAEVSVYPQNTHNAGSIISNAITEFDQETIQCKVGDVSTHLTGNDEQVWQCLKAAWDSAKEAGEVSMVVTFTNINTH